MAKTRPSLPGLRLLGALTLCLTWPGVSAAQEGALSLELRAGALYSTPLADARVVVLDPQQPVEREMELGGGVAPFLAVGLLRDFGSRIWGEVQLGASFAGVDGDGPGGTWDAGSLSTFHGTLGVRVGLDYGLDFRGGVGFVVLSASDDFAAFQEGDDTGLLVGGAVGYRPLEDLPLRVEAGAQRHDFGTPALRRAGAQDGSIQRYLLTVSYLLSLGGEG